MGSTRRSAPWLGSVAVHVAIGAGWLAARSSAPVRRDVVTTAIMVDVIEPVPIAAMTTLVTGGVPLPPSPDRPPARRRAAPVPRGEAPIVRAAPAPADQPPVPPVPDQPAVATSPIPAHAAHDAPGSATASAPIAAPGAAGTRTPPGVVRVAARPPTDGALAMIDHAAGGPRLRPRSPRLISNAARPAGGDGGTPDDGEYVAILTIDTDGAVIGAKLKRGPPGHRCERAMAAVWRFRYHPALDGDGQPIVSRVEQRFVVE